MLKLKFLLLISLFTLALLSCKVRRNTPVKGGAWSVVFEKAGCLDVCKAYTISINSNGKFAYKGNFKVKHMGLKTGTLKSDELKEINRLRKAIKWNTLKNNYGTNNKQLKVVTYITTTIDKKITYFSGEPLSIKDLENYIDTIINKDEL